MTVKITDLPLTTSLSNGTVLYVVDPIGPTSKKTTLASVANLISPIASQSVRGLVKIGSGLSVDVDGVISATSVSGNAATVTNGVYTTGSYADPSWITSLSASKVGLGNVTNESKATMFASPTFTGTVNGITATMIGLGNVTNESKTTMFNNPTFTGTVSGINATMVGLANVTNESKATMFASPTFTGTVSGITATMVGLSNVTNESKSQMFSSPTFTGTVSGVTKSMVGLGNVDNTADANKSVAYALTAGSAPASDVYTWAKASTKPSYTAAEIGLGNVANESKASLFSSPDLTGVPTAPTATAGTNTTQIATTAFVSTAVSNLVASAPSALDTLNELATALGNDANFATTVSTAIGLKAPLANPSFSGTVSGITATMVGLGNVTNESKATMFASPTFTGTVSGVTATMVGLGNVTNESKATMFTGPTFTGHPTIEGVTSTGATGTGKLVFDTSPTFATPILGSATATSINKMAITAPASSSTLAIADTKTFTVSNSITLAGTDSTTITLPSTTGTVALNNQTFYIGSTSIAINRSSANLALTGITSIDGSAASVANALTISTGLSGTSYNGSSAVTIAIDSTVTTLTGTQTLTNKRVSPRVATTSSATTITPTADSCDMYTVTALAAAATIAAPSGTPTDGQRLLLRIKDNGTARALTWTSSSGAYRSVGVGILPNTTVVNRVLYVGCIYNAQDTYWDVISYSQQ